VAERRNDTMAAVPLPIVRRAVANYFTGRPYCVSFELTHNCNARCRHCHRGESVRERLATPEQLLEVCRQLRPIVAIMSGGEPLLRRDLPQIVRTLKRGCVPLRVFLNTNAALLTLAVYGELAEAGVDEVLISFDYPDERHDEFRKIPGLFRRIETLIRELDPENRKRVVLTCVLQSDNYRHALDMARMALDWGVNINFSAYTPMRTNDQTLMIPPHEMAEFRQVVARLRDFKRAHHNVLTSDWVMEGMVTFFDGGRRTGCRAGQRFLVVNPDGTLSPCGLLVRDYATFGEIRREFTAHNDCALCYTSTRGNSERPARYLFLDHLDYLRRRAGHA
jgi:MoaA/NifB/PqqE/SkfB family radical SAM enzyme